MGYQQVGAKRARVSVDEVGFFSGFFDALTLEVFVGKVGMETGYIIQRTELVGNKSLEGVLGLLGSTGKPGRKWGERDRAWSYGH